MEKEREACYRGGKKWEGKGNTEEGDSTVPRAWKYDPEDVVCIVESLRSEGVWF